MPEEQRIPDDEDDEAVIWDCDYQYPIDGEGDDDDC